MRIVPRSALILFASLVLSAQAAPEEPLEVTIYKSPSCGCCSKWVRHMEEHGFSVEAHDVPDVAPIKIANAVPKHLASCHTAFVGGYIVEGHVPASDVARLLAERPPVAGLAVPGMPIGSPGMEGPDPEAYRVLSFDAEGRIRIFSSHRP
jgi:hypothetical protein